METTPGLLEEAWRKHLFNQFHDILSGSGVPATYQYALGLGLHLVRVLRPPHSPDIDANRAGDTLLVLGDREWLAMVRERFGTELV